MSGKGGRGGVLAERNFRLYFAGNAMGFPALGVLVLGTIAEVTGVRTATLGAAILTLFLLIWLSRRLGRARASLEVE